MSTKNQSYTIDEEVIYKLEVFASAENLTKSRAVNKILRRFLNVEVEISLTDTPYEKKEAPPKPVQTEEERIADWEWRKKMVAEGKLPVHMGEEYPQMQEGEDIYLDPGAETEEEKKQREGKVEMERLALEEQEKEKKRKVVENETQQEMEDREFDESVEMSIKEPE